MAQTSAVRFLNTQDCLTTNQSDIRPLAPSRDDWDLIRMRLNPRYPHLGVFYHLVGLASDQLACLVLHQLFESSLVTLTGQEILNF